MNETGTIILTTARLWLKVMPPSANEAVRGYFRRAWTFGEDWLPAPPADFFTLQGQRRRLAAEAEARAAGRSLRLFLGRQDEAPTRVCGDIWIDPIDRALRQTATIEGRLEERSTRQGFMTEALGQVIAFLGSEYGLRQLEAWIAPQHHAARRLAKRCGFQPVAGVTCWRLTGQGWLEHQLYRCECGCAHDGR